MHVDKLSNSEAGLHVCVTLPGAPGFVLPLWSSSLLMILSLLLQVLVMHGESDPICEAADAANLARHISGSELLEVAGADHWYKDRQQQLLEAVRAFVLRAGREKHLCRTC